MQLALIIFSHSMIYVTCHLQKQVVPYVQSDSKYNFACFCMWIEPSPVTLTGHSQGVPGYGGQEIVFFQEAGNNRGV